MLEQKISHHIQRAILHTLMLHDHVRYSELKPHQLESNVFMYHLNQLIKQGLVEKSQDGYRLTQDGKIYAGRSNLASLKIRIQPKIISILMVKREDGQWLLLQRKHQPNLNYAGFPSGKIHFGESLQDAAERELAEKATIYDVPLTLRGNMVMRFLNAEKTVINHIIGYVFSGTAPINCAATNETEFFRSFWGPEQKLFERPAFKGHKELLELLVANPKGTLFFKEFEFLSDY